MRTIILDFVGVVADIDFKKLIWNLPLKEKFSALRIILSLKKFPDLKYCFQCYQTGLSTLTQLEEDVSYFLPKSSYVIPELMKELEKNIKVNLKVLSLVNQLKAKGIQVILLSNSIPETETVMKKYNLNSIFDGVVLSHHLNLMKPQKKIYQYTIETYNLSPEQTLMIDDTRKNLLTANKVGINTIKSKTSKNTCEILQDYIDYLESTNQA